MSMFNSFGGRHAAGGLPMGSLGRPGAPMDPAADIARLLNQHTHNWMAMEKEIKDVKSKQEAVQDAYVAAVEAREVARVRLVEAESALAGAQAERSHCRSELEASQAANSRLMSDVESVKAEVAGVTEVADEARREFTEQVAEMMAALKQLRVAHPASFCAGAAVHAR